MDLLYPISPGPFLTNTNPGGGTSHPPIEKIFLDIFWLIFLNICIYICIRTKNVKGQVSKFKTLGFIAMASSATNLTNASENQKSKIYKGKFGVQLFPRAAKN
jgi:hypothetical protein